MAGMERFTGTRALITGGSRGIGAAVARRLAAEGAAVTITYRSNAGLAEALVAELTEAGHTAFAFRSDVRDRAAAHQVARAAADRMGGLDVLVSNAGVEYFGPLAGITEDDVRRILDTNVAGQLWAVQAAVPLMTGGGRIVLMSSVSNGIAVYEHSLYAASKAAVVALARNLAPELAARDIAINAIAPGGTATDMATENARHYTHPLLRGYDMSPKAQISLHASLGRLAEPAEIAAAIAFLVSPDAAYLNGATLAADGGWM
jgi:3-oxoacyl-[acyl-carrier protein] reductase